MKYIVSANTGVDWTNPGIAPIPDSLPTVYSSEDWQAAFGFQTEMSRSSLHLSPKSSPAPSPRISFGNEDFIADTEEAYTSVVGPFDSAISDPTPTNNIASSLLANTTVTSKFMAEFQQNSLQQRLAMQVRGVNYINYFISLFFRRWHFRCITGISYCTTSIDSLFPIQFSDIFPNLQRSLCYKSKMNVCVVSDKPEFW